MKGREQSWCQDVRTRGASPRRLFKSRSEQESHRYCGDRQSDMCLEFSGRRGRLGQIIGGLRSHIKGFSCVHRHRHTHTTKQIRKPSIVAHTSDSSLECEAGGLLRVGGRGGLHNEFQASLGCSVRPPQRERGFGCRETETRIEVGRLLHKT